MIMKKKYVNNLPNGKKVIGTEVSVEDGKLVIEVEFEDEFDPNDGDFLVSRIGKVFIYSKKTPDNRFVYSAYCGVRKDDVIRIDFSKKWALAEGCRFATPEEKSDFLDRLKNELGKKWNPDTKELEDIRWRADKDCTYYYVDERGNVLGCNDTRGCASDSRYSCGNYFKTREAARPYSDQIKKIFKKSKAE